MSDKNLSIIAIAVGIIFLAFVKWNGKDLTSEQKSQRSLTITMGLLWLLGGITLLSFSLAKT